MPASSRPYTTARSRSTSFSRRLSAPTAWVATASNAASRWSFAFAGMSAISSATGCNASFMATRSRSASVSAARSRAEIPASRITCSPTALSQMANPASAHAQSQPSSCPPLMRNAATTGSRRTSAGSSSRELAARVVRASQMRGPGSRVREDTRRTLGGVTPCRPPGGVDEVPPGPHEAGVDRRGPGPSGPHGAASGTA